MLTKLLKSKVYLAAFLIAGLVIGCNEANIISDVSEAEETDLPELQPGDIIEGSYIVVLRSDLDEVESKGKLYVDQIRNALLTEVDISGDVVVRSYDTALQGFSAQLDEAQLNRLRANERVDYIEPDRVIALAPPCGTPREGPCDDDPDEPEDPEEPENPDPDDPDPENPEEPGDAIVPWGIERVGGAVTYTGSAVAWVLDSGIQTDHPDLNVDASRGLTVFTRGADARDTDDRNGHGTHVAGTIAGKNGILGVASGAIVIPVKVLDRNGGGSVSGVIAGVDHVAANASAGDVANMSLGGSFTSALNTAVENAADKGIFFTLSSGNNGAPAENYSPGSVNHPNTWTIGATDINDNWASFSNYGPPTSFAAPGVAIQSTWINSGYRTISGTSMSAPHVAGILLVNNGNVGSDGQSSPAPDGVRYPIASHK